MLNVSAFKGVEKGLVDSLDSGGMKASLGIHNSLLQIGNSTYTNAAGIGAGLGAAYGALDGAFSYDGSVLGGAFHGAMLGGAGGAGARFASKLYGQGAVKSGFAEGSQGSFKNSWNTTNSAFKKEDGSLMGAFQTSAFKAGW